MIVFYSPRTSLEGGEPLQAFTASGVVEDDEPYQAEMTPSFHSWRRRLRFVQAQEAPIAALIAELGFIKDKQRWGLPFRRGLFEIDEADFARISDAMGMSPAEC